MPNSENVLPYRWRKGQSGNPTGKRHPSLLRQILERADEMGSEQIIDPETGETMSYVEGAARALWHRHLLKGHVAILGEIERLRSAAGAADAIGIKSFSDLLAAAQSDAPKPTLEMEPDLGVATSVPRNDEDDAG
jgi:hypothetical protein